MNTEFLVISAKRDEYSPMELLNHTLTISELIEYLQEFDPDTPVIIGNDNNYTFGAVRKTRIDTIEHEE